MRTRPSCCRTSRWVPAQHDSPTPCCRVAPYAIANPVSSQAVGHAANGNGTGSCRTRARRVHLSPYVTPVPDNGAMVSVLPTDHAAPWAVPVRPTDQVRCGPCPQQQAMARLISNHYGKPATRVNFLKLDLAALRKYQEFHKLAVSKVRSAEVHDLHAALQRVESLSAHVLVSARPGCEPRLHPDTAGEQSACHQPPSTGRADEGGAGRAGGPALCVAAGG